MTDIFRFKTTCYCVRIIGWISMITKWKKNPLGEIVSDKIAPNAVMQKGQGFKSYEPVNTTWVW